MDEAGCIIQREISQTQKDKYCMLYLICGCANITWILGGRGRRPSWAPRHQVRCAGGHTAKNGLKMVFTLCHYTGSQICPHSSWKEAKWDRERAVRVLPKRTHLHPGLHSRLRQGQCRGLNQSHGGSLVGPMGCTHDTGVPQIAPY